MTDTQLTLIGNLTADPELRYTPSGTAMANFTVASTSRIYCKQTSRWEDGETLFLRCIAWKRLAENVAELVKCTRVIVQGTLRARSYTDRDGGRRTAIEIDAEEVGVSVAYATARLIGNRNAGPDPWAGTPTTADKETA